MEDKVYTRKVWSMAIAGSLLNFMGIGMTRANGLLFVALMEADKTLSRGAASWPFNLPGVVSIFAAPMTGFMMARYSPFVISSIGSILILAGSLPCYFSTNIYVLSVFFGVIKGFGTGMITTIIPVVINKTFKTHRATAMGISSVGISSGGLLWPILVQILLDRYGLNSTFLWLTIISLSTFFFGITYIQYPDTQKPKPIDEKKSDDDGHNNPGFTDETTPILPHSSKSQYQSLNLTEETEERTTTTCLDTNVEKVNDGVIFSKISTHPDSRIEKEGQLNDVGQETADLKNTNTSLGNTPIKKAPERISTTQLLKKVFTNRGFYMIALSQTFIIYLSAIFGQVIVDYLGDKGIPSDLSLFMITSLSVGEIFGRIGLGWITDKKFLSRPIYSSAILIILAVMPLLLTFTANYNALMTVAFVLGALQGSFLSINTVQFTDYVSKDEMPLAMAFARSINGVGALTRSPIIGLFRDQAGSYDYLFHLLTGTTALLGIGWGIEGIVGSKNKKRTQREELKV